MPRKRKIARLKERVACAYYEYGRFCSSHPFMCISMSIFTILLSSYPVSRFRVPSSRPMDIYWSDKASDSGQMSENKPDWLYLLPTVYVQQIIVRSKVEPWDPRKLTPIQGVKGPLSRSFLLEKRLREFASPKDGSTLDNFCFYVEDSPSTTHLLPSQGCLLLSPSLFWQNDDQKFYKDDKILDSIFGPACTSAMCPRDLLFGIPTRLTGVKRQYNTNRQRGIDFTVTVVLSQYNPDYLTALKHFLNTTEFQLLSSTKEDGSKAFVHVFYRTRKYTNDYLPLLVSYCVLIIYVYFSSTKIEMVKSKWGLTAAATFTVVFSLFMAAGICIQFELTPAFWGAELFPYLAMIVGLENTLCITRSVAWTPVSMDARSRIAHGLSIEGWSITKNFLTELVIILVGFFTFVPEIQEFCTFACVGLVVDFYMQLFFYAPCLTFDLLRIGSDEKQEFGINQFKREPLELKMYPALHCPFERILPSFFDDSNPEQKMYRVKSESGLTGSKAQIQKEPATIRKGHRRAVSSISNSDVFLDVEPSHFLRVLPVRSRRLRFLYYWTKTRFFQRFLMVAMVLWIIWFACIVHQWQLIGQLSSVFKSPDSTQLEKAGSIPMNSRFDNTEWSLWQKRTFRWWPVLFDHYNWSLSGHYITLLPPIVLKSSVSPDDPSITFSGGQEHDRSASKDQEPIGEKVPQSGISTLWDRMGGGALSYDIKLRVSWLELQMTLVLVISCGIFVTVAVFILYVCFAGRSQDGLDSLPQPKKPTHKRVGSKGIVESVPLLFTGHEQDVECLCAPGNEILVSSCIGGKIMVWDGMSGDCIRSLPRSGISTPPPRRINDDTSTERNQNEDSVLRRRTVPVNPTNRSSSPATQGYDFGRFVSRTTSHQQSTQQRIPLNNNLPTPTPVWCLTVRSNMAIAGCANGAIEFWDIETGGLLGLYKSNNITIGVTHVQMRGGRLIVARLNGSLEFVELKLVAMENDQSDQPQRRLHCDQLKSITAHQRPINCLKTAAMTVVSASTDHTLKLFDLRTCTHAHTLHGHNAPVLSITIDEGIQVLYSSCTQGVICCWDLIDGTLLRTLSEVAYTNSQLALASTGQLLLGYSQDCHLWLWRKNTGELVTRIKRSNSEDEKIKKSSGFRNEKPALVALAENLAVTAYAGSIQFWDLEYKVLLREVKLDSSPGANVQHLLNLDSKTVACCKGNSIYRISLPLIKFK